MLTQIAVKNAKPEEKPYKLADSRGLYLLVHPNGGKYWRWKYRFEKKERVLAIGVFPEIGLAEAREKQADARKLLKDGIDPNDAKRTKARKAEDEIKNTFQAITLEWLEIRKSSWSEYYSRQVLQRLELDNLDWPTSEPVQLARRRELPAPKQFIGGDTELSEILELLKVIDPDITRDDWIKVGMVIHHETQGSDDGFELWDKWSSAGSKYSDQEALRYQWDSFKLDRENPVTKGTLLMIARKHGYIEDISKDFGVIIEDRLVGSKRFEILTAAEFAAGKPPTWIVQDVLPEAGLAMIFGESGAGKTFFALDLVASIARGEPWRSHKVKKGSVVYIAAEGVGGLRKRLKAYAQHNEVSLDDLDINFISDAPNLHENDNELLIRDIFLAFLPFNHHARFLNACSAQGGCMGRMGRCRIDFV